MESSAELPLPAGGGRGGLAGLQVWEVTSGRRLRHFTPGPESKPATKFHSIHVRKDVVTLTEIENDGEIACQVTVMVLSLREVCDGQVPDDKLWRREQEVKQPRYGYKHTNAVSTNTSLVISHSKGIDVRDFWNSPVLRHTTEGRKIKRGEEPTTVRRSRRVEERRGAREEEVPSGEIIKLGE